MRLKTKQFIKTASRSLLGVLTYDLFYRLSFPLKQAYGETIKQLDEMNTTELLDLDWVEEANYDHTMSHKVIPYLNSLVRHGVSERRQFKLHYQFYTHAKNHSTLVITHGYNEFHEKYYELVYYFLQLGFDVITYDVRGHGFSRKNPHQQLIDVENFEDYIFDLENILATITAKYKMKQPFYLFGHSMGGAVATAFVYNYPDLFQGLILSSPMFNIDTHPLPRSLTHLFSAVATATPLRKQQIPFQVEEGESLRNDYQFDARMARSEARARYYHQLNLEHHEVPTKGGTLRWLNTSMSYLQNMLHSDYLKQIKLPTLIFQATDDTVVRNDGIMTAVNYLPEAHVINVAEAGHEIYQDKDKIIKPYITKMAKFLAILSLNI